MDLYLASMGATPEGPDALVPGLYGGRQRTGLTAMIMFAIRAWCHPPMQLRCLAAWKNNCSGARKDTIYGDTISVTSGATMPDASDPVRANS